MNYPVLIALLVIVVTVGGGVWSLSHWPKPPEQFSPLILRTDELHLGWYVVVTDCRPINYWLHCQTPNVWQAIQWSKQIPDSKVETCEFILKETVKMEDPELRQEMRRAIEALDADNYQHWRGISQSVPEARHPSTQRLG